MDTQARKFLLTINNPRNYGLDHTSIKDILATMAIEYACICDEIGELGTFHTHVFFVTRSAMRFSTVERRFKVAHIDSARGTVDENISYIKKEGKWATTSKSETSIQGSFEEIGTPPKEAKPQSEARTLLQKYLIEGKTTKEIVELLPEYNFKTKQIDELRQCLTEEKYKEEFRQITVTYIYGKTGVGKTYSILTKYGAKNVCRITNYSGDKIFDAYAGQDVLVLDEFDSQIPLSSLLTYLDRYPVDLPARFYDRTACFTKVYILSNLEYEQQYSNERKYLPEKWAAFNRRVKNIFYMHDGGKITVVRGVAENFIPT